MRSTSESSCESRTASSRATLTAIAQSDRGIALSWPAAVDPETGVLGYDIYRDGTKIATVRQQTFSDDGLSELTAYSYEVRAVNLHGDVGPGVTATATTLADPLFHDQRNYAMAGRTKREIGAKRKGLARTLNTLFSSPVSLGFAPTEPIHHLYANGLPPLEGLSWAGRTNERGFRAGGPVSHGGIRRCCGALDEQLTELV